MQAEIVKALKAEMLAFVSAAASCAESPRAALSSVPPRRPALLRGCWPAAVQPPRRSFAMRWPAANPQSSLCAAPQLQTLLNEEEKR